MLAVLNTTLKAKIISQTLSTTAIGSDIRKGLKRKYEVFDRPGNLCQVFSIGPTGKRTNLGFHYASWFSPCHYTPIERFI